MNDPRATTRFVALDRSPRIHDLVYVASVAKHLSIAGVNGITYGRLRAEVHEHQTSRQMQSVDASSFHPEMRTVGLHLSPAGLSSLSCIHATVGIF